MKKIFKITCAVVIALAAIVLGINFVVVGVGAKHIADTVKIVEEESGNNEITKADCILVLGAQVKPDGMPSHMLRDRLNKGIELYKAGYAPKLLMSGDNGQVEYNEVKTMYEYAKDAGVPSKDIFLDYAGFSTYESMYRARDIFGVDKVIVVTQKYHEYRALYIGQRLGLETQGVCADPVTYSGQTFREIREILARDKDFFKCIAQPEPTFLGEKIDITGDGRETQ